MQKMVRQRNTRKSVEELYSSNKTFLNSSKAPRTVRAEHDFTNNNNNNNVTNYAFVNNACKAQAFTDRMGTQNNMVMINRRKCTRTNFLQKEKFCGKEEKMVNLDEVKKNQFNKAKTARPEKCNYNNDVIYDGKNFTNFVENANQNNILCNNNHCNHIEYQQRMQQQQQKHAGVEVKEKDKEKDDETEEFFDLIRQTVDNALLNINDNINRNFQELSAKVDQFSTELQATNVSLQKLQHDINSKVVHYGEENSRHFRYLCMKSEYDKMFYQHQSLLNVPGAGMPRASTVETTRANVSDGENKVPCTCRASDTKLPASEPIKTTSEVNAASQRSSEVGMQDVLQHIQRLCNQMQLNEFKDEEELPKPKFNAHGVDMNMKINKQIFDEDDEEDSQSSDGMTPRSAEQNLHHKYGGKTMRGATSRTTGAGDA